MLRIRCIVEQPMLDGYYKIMAVDRVRVDGEIIWARPYELKYVDKITGQIKQFGILAYPKYAWKLF
jgi:hypothetical protein